MKGEHVYVRLYGHLYEGRVWDDHGGAKVIVLEAGAIRSVRRENVSRAIECASCNGRGTVPDA